MTDNLPPRLILFDGVCNLCNTSVQFVISHDPQARFSFASLQSEAGQKLLKEFDLPLVDFDSFVYIREGKVYQRSSAALNVLKDLGGLWQIVYIFIIVPRPVRDWGYDLIARHRYQWFGKREVCMMPTPDLRKRFL